MAKDAIVARPLRADWSQLLSSVRNMLCVSSGAGPLSLQTPAAGDWIPSTEGKTHLRGYCGLPGRRREAALLEPSKTQKDRVGTRSLEATGEWSRNERAGYCFGVLGVAGLAAGLVAGLGAALPAGGAGTPDCVL